MIQLKNILSHVKGKFLILILLTLIQTGVSFSIPWLNKILIDEILINNQFQLIFFIVAKMVGAHSFIEELPNKYDSI